MFSSTSTTTCANFYNTAISQSKEPLPEWLYGFSLSSDHVWSAFLLFCLLDDVIEHEEYVIIKHTGDQKNHFVDLVQACNQCWWTEGQPELTHFCDQCTRWYLNGDGKDMYTLSCVINADTLN